MNTRQRAAASRETAAKRQPGTHGFRARLLRREVRRWHASWKRGSTFCPLDGVCRCWWASQGGVGAALCFLGGRCRRCGLQGPASELVGVAAADAVVRVLEEVAQRRSSPPLRRSLLRGALDTPLARRKAQAAGRPQSRAGQTACQQQRRALQQKARWPEGRHKSVTGARWPV